MDITLLKEFAQFGLGGIALFVLSFFLWLITKNNFETQKKKDEVIYAMHENFMKTTNEYTSIIKNHLEDFRRSIEHLSDKTDEQTDVLKDLLKK